MTNECFEENIILKNEIAEIKKELLKTKVDYDVQTSHLKRLIELSSILNTSLELEDVLVLFFRYISNIFYFTKGTFSFIQNKEIYEYEVDNEEGEIKLKILNKEHYMILRKFKEHMEKSKTEIVFSKTDDLMNFKNSSIRAFIGIPIIYNSQYSGEIFLISDEENVYTEKEGKIICNLINHIITYIENAILFERVNELSIKDSLTDIYNRRYFFDVAEKEFFKSKRSKKKSSLILCDIDHFKRINDKKGHLVGDKILKEVADLLKGLLRNSDVLARYGGEEFIILLPETGEVEAMQVADRIRDSIEKEEFSKSKVTLSFGITVYGGETVKNSIDELVEEADNALYEAKERGRNRVELFRGEGC